MTTSMHFKSKVVLAALVSLTGRAAMAEFETIINVPPEQSPRRVLSNMQVNLFDGGVLPSTYSSPFWAGRPPRSGAPDSGTHNVEVNIHGGEVGEWFHAHPGTIVNVSGGLLGYGFQALDGSRVNLSGGIVDRGFEVFAGGEVVLSGGVIGRGISAEPGSQVTLVGGEFKLNGVDVVADSVTFDYPDVLSGTLADGSSIILSPLLGDRLETVTLSSAPVPERDLTPIVVNSEVAPSGIRDGQTLTLEEGGVLPEQFVAVNAALNIHGGYINGLAAIGSQVNIGGGDILGLDSFAAFHGTHVVFCGGISRSAFEAHDGSVVTVVSGEFDDNFDAKLGSKVTITGGTMDGSLYAYEGSELTLVGTEFYLDGEPFAGLTAPGESHILQSRDWEVLSGKLSDGSAFEFDNRRPIGFGGITAAFDQNALLRLTIAIPGDYNNNGQVEQGDLDLVLTNWGHNMAAVPSGWIASAPDGPIDQQELDAVLLHWGRGAPVGAGAVPEPSSVILAMLSAGVGATFFGSSSRKSVTKRPPIH